MSRKRNPRLRLLARAVFAILQPFSALKLAMGAMGAAASAAGGWMALLRNAILFIGRALLRGPRFLLMDEPLSSLDAARREEIMAVIERIRDELRLPILYVSHDRAEVERLADTVIPIGG